MTFPPNDPRAAPVREAILGKFDKSSRMVVLVGQSTHASKWVHWEIVEFFNRKRRRGHTIYDRIIAMRLRRCPTAELPRALAGRSDYTIAWNVDELDRWLDADLVVKEGTQ